MYRFLPQIFTICMHSFGGKIENLRRFSKLLLVLLFSTLLVSCLSKEGSDQVSNGSLGLKLAIMSGNNQTGDPGRLFSESLEVMVQDALGEPVEGLTIEFFEVSSEGAYITNSVTTTNSQGYAVTDVKAPSGHNSSLTIAARIQGSPEQILFTLNTSEAPEGGRFVIESTGSGTEVAGVPFGFTVRLEAEGGGVLNYNGTITTQWLFDSQPSWGQIAPTVLPATYDCLFVAGVCTVPASVILTDARDFTYVYMGDGIEGFEDVFAQPITVQKNVPAQVVVVTGSAGGPDNGATVVADTTLNADMPALNLFAAVTDSVGNYIQDASTVTWNGTRSEITNYLTDNGDGTASFDPTRSINFPGTGKITIDVGGYPQGMSGAIGIDPGIPTTVQINPETGGLTRTAGELMKFGLIVRDAQNNICAQDSTSQGYTGAVDVTLTFSDYLTGPEASGGVVPEIFYNEATQDGELEGQEAKSYQSTDYTFTTNFVAGVSSVAEVARGIQFFDATSVNPKVQVDLASPSLQAVSTTTTFNMVVGPEHHITLRDAPGEAGEAVCQGYYDPMSAMQTRTLADLYGEVVGSQGPSYNSQTCKNITARAGDTPITYYFAMEDAAGNFISNVIARVDFGGSTTASEFTGQFSPITNSATTTFTPLSLAGGQGGYIDIEGMIGGTLVKNRIFGSVGPAAFDRWEIGVQWTNAANRPVYADFTRNPVAGRTNTINVVARDIYGNLISASTMRNFNVSVTGTLTNSPRGFPPTQVPSGTINIPFANGIGGINFIPMNASDTITVQFEDVATGDLSNVYTFSPIANDPNYIELRTGLGMGAGTDLTNAAMPITTDDTYTIYANLFDFYGNFKECVNVDWSDPGLTYFNPSDAATYTNVGCSTILDPRKPTAMASRLGATYTWYDPVLDMNRTITSQTGDINIDTGALAQIIVAPTTNNMPAGTTTNVDVTLKDAKNNTLNFTGSKNVAITPVKNDTTRLGYSENFSASTSLMFAAGAANFNATFYNSLKTPSINVSTTDPPFVAGQSAKFAITPAPLDHLYLSTGGGMNPYIYAGDTDRYYIYAEDEWGNRLTSGPESTINVTFDLTNPALTTQDITATALTGATSVAGANDTSVTGNLSSGGAWVEVTSDTAGIMTVDGTSATPINEANNTETYLTIRPIATIDDIAFEPGKAPLTNHTASPVTPLFPFRVQILDVFDNVITTNDTDTVTLSLDSGTGTLGGTLNKAVTNGVVEFDDIIYTKPEAIVLRLTLDSNPAKTITANVTVGVGGISRTIVQMPDQTYTPSVSSLGAAITGVPFNLSGGSATAGSSHTVLVRAVDAAYNTVQSFSGSVTLTTSDPNAVIAVPTVNASSGVATFNVTFRRQGNHTATATTPYPDSPSSTYTIDPGAASQLLVLLPGQVLDEGAPDLDEAIDNPATTGQSAGNAFNVKLVAVDNFYNKVTDKDGQTVSLTTSDPNDSHPAGNTLSSGERQFSVTNTTAGTGLTITPSGASLTPRVSESYDLVGGTAIQTIVRMPGQTFNPGATTYGTAITGTPTVQKAAQNFDVDVYAVDAYFNVDPSYSGAVSIATPNDPSDTHPVAPTNFSSGQVTFTISPVKAVDNQKVAVTSPIDDTTNVPADYDVTPGNKAYLITLFDNQTLNQGQTSYAAAVTPSAVTDKTANSSFNVTVYGTDVYYNVITTDSSTSVPITTSAPNDNHPANKTLASGQATFTLTNYKAGTNYTVQASNAGGYTGLASNTYNLNAGTASHLIVILPGETLSEGHDTLAEAASGTASKQTVGYTYPVQVFLTDSAYNRVAGTPSVSLNIGPQSSTGGGAQALIGGTATYNITHTAAGTNQTITAVNASYTKPASETYDVIAAFGTPTLALSDGTTSSTTHTRQVATATSIGTDSTAYRWCLSTAQTTQPTSGTNGRLPCGGGGGSDSGWYTSRPSSINLPAGDGAKTVYLWIADQANNVSSAVVTDSITLDTGKPAVPTVSISDPSNADTSYTNQSPVDLSITGDTDAVDWLVIEQSSGSPAPTKPLFSDGNWVSTRPTSQAMGGTDSRTVYVFTKDIANNVSDSAGSASIYHDNANPGIHAITGVYGGTDVTPDTTLASTQTPTISWSTASDSTLVTYSVLIKNASSADQCGGTQTTTATSFNFTGCNLNNGETYTVFLSAEDAAENTRAASNNGTFTFTVDISPPDPFTITGATGGTDSTTDIWLTSGDRVTANWNDTNGEDGYKVSILNAGDTEVCSEALLASNSTNYNFAGCALSNDTVYKIKVIAYDSVGNEREATNSPMSFTVSNSATKFLVEKVGGGNPVAGTAFDLRITAQKPNNDTDTGYGGIKTIDISVVASSGNNKCGAVTLTPDHPGDDAAVSFTNGVATISSGVTFKKAESGVSITATEDGSSVTGTLSSLTVDAGAQNCIRIETAAGGAGSPLGAQAMSIHDDFTAYAVGYDANGNFVANPSVTWSGSSDLANLPLPATGSSTRLVGVKSGSGNLTASGSSDSIGVTVATGTTDWLASDIDNNSNNTLANNNTNIVLHWDVMSDADSAWRTNSGLSWHSEATSATRGSRDDFPREARLVLNSSALDIIDAQSNDLFIRFNLAAGAALDSSLGSATSLAAENGKVFVGFDGGSSGGLIILDLKADAIFKITDSDRLISDQVISGRNVTTAIWSADTTYQLIATTSDRVKSLANYYDGTNSYIAIGTQDGVNIMKLNATTSIYKDDTTGAVSSIDFDSNDSIYYVEDGTGLHRSDLTLPLTVDFTHSRTYDLNSSAELSSLSINEIKVVNGQSDADSGKNLILVASDLGATAIHEHGTASSSTSRTYVTKGAGSSNFNGALYVDGSSGYLSFSNTGNITNSMTLEFWFKPSINYNSGSAVTSLVSLGNPNIDGSIGLELNPAADGKLEFFVRHSSADYSVFSSNTTWNANQWYHIAVTIDGANGISLWVDGSNRQTNSVNLTSFNLNTADDYNFGSDTSSFFSGFLDEIRIQSNIIYSTASFTVPSSQLPNDGSTEYLYRLNESSGSSAAYLGAGGGSAATLNGNALFTYPLIQGSSNQISAVDAVNSTTVSGHLVSGSHWVELSNLDDSTAATSAVIDSQSGSFNDVEVFHIDSASDSDVLLGEPANGFTTINR